MCCVSVHSSKAFWLKFILEKYARKRWAATRPVRSTSYYLYTIKIFFMKLPKQPKERFPNIYFTFADPETRFFDLKKYFVNLVSV